MAAEQPATDQQIWDLLCQGRSVFLTGGGGVGKTYTTQQILESVEERKWHDGSTKIPFIVRTATTGVASLHLKGGGTLHSMTNLPVNDVPTLEQWKSISISTAKSRLPYLVAIVRQIREADVLMIDEVSMMSAWLFELLDLRLRIWRRSDKPFGGLVLLLVGDFLQLRPVYNEKALPPPSKRQDMFCFQSRCWSELNPHMIHLTTIHRQSNPAFAKLCNGLRWGQRLPQAVRNMLMSKNSKEFDETAVQIMVKRDDVFASNKLKLAEIKEAAAQFHFPLSWEGSNKDMKTALIRDVRQGLYIPYEQKTQEFKVGARVMLIVNALMEGLDRYANGDRGTVVGFTDPPSMVETLDTCLVRPGEYDLEPGYGRYPVVRFDRTDMDICVKPHTFQRDIKNGDKVEEFARVIAIPLCLAWASTVHKAQGATISGKVHINCYLTNYIPGTFYVALSRATDLANVTFSGFRVEGKASPEAILFYKGQYKYTKDDQEILDTIRELSIPKRRANYDQHRLVKHRKM